MNDIATRFLDTYAAGGEVEGGWLYAKALQQTRLDYTPESLARLDHLLKQVRERVQPTPAVLDTPKGRNFMSLLAFYVIKVLERRTGSAFDWYDRASALAALPDGTPLPDGSLTRLVAVNEDQGVAYWPLGWLEAQLAQEGPRRLAADFVEHMVQQVQRHGPAVWWRAAFTLGQMAAWEMMAAAGPSGSVMPTLLTSLQPRTFTMLGSSLFGGPSVADSVRRGAELMEKNPDGATWQVMGYDGILNEDGRSLDAVMVVAAAYGEQPMMLKIAFPYLPARDGQPFAILQPVLRETTMDKDTFERVFHAIERGIHSLKWPDGESWEHHRAAAITRQRVVPAPTPAFVVPSAPLVPGVPVVPMRPTARAAPAPAGSATAADNDASAPARTGWRMW